MIKFNLYLFLCRPKRETMHLKCNSFHAINSMLHLQNAYATLTKCINKHILKFACHGYLQMVIPCYKK